MPSAPLPVSSVQVVTTPASAVRKSREVGFDDAKEGKFSPLYEWARPTTTCLVVALSKVYKKGYLPLRQQAGEGLPHRNRQEREEG